VKHRYVVDLNVVRFAQTLTDEKGQRTLDSLRLVTELVARCHSLITCAELYRKYSKLADRLRDAGVAQGLSVFALANTAASVSEKWLRVSQPPAVKGDEQIPDDDRVLVRLAVANRANLVTTDGRLILAVTKTEILQKRGLQALTVQQALAQVMSD
jgi:hypothetical protein